MRTFFARQLTVTNLLFLIAFALLLPTYAVVLTTRNLDLPPLQELLADVALLVAMVALVRWYREFRRL